MREQNVSLGGKNVIAKDKLVVLEDSNGEICPATEAFALALFLSLHLSNGNNIKSQTEEIKKFNRGWD